MKTLAFAATIGLMVSGASAQQLLIDAKSTVSGTDPTLVNRLFQADGTTPAPTGTVIWYVADVSNNGLVLNSAGPNSVFDIDFSNPNSILGSDNIFLFEARVGDGIALPAARPGKVNKTGVGVPDTLSIRNATIYALLFNQQDPVFTPVPGDTFGIFNLGNPTEPPLGSTPYFITGNVSWNTYTVTAVPEPSTYAMMLLGGLGVLGYRRFKK
jgi:hypothetical protein